MLGLSFRLSSCDPCFGTGCCFCINLTRLKTIKFPNYSLKNWPIVCNNFCVTTKVKETKSFLSCVSFVLRPVNDNCFCFVVSCHTVGCCNCFYLGSSSAFSLLLDVSALSSIRAQAWDFGDKLRDCGRLWLFIHGIKLQQQKIF
jgi:hypothetical protein